MDPCDYCDAHGSWYCRNICGNPCYGCPDYSEEIEDCTSDGACVQAYIKEEKTNGSKDKHTGI